jgi:predicted phosphodiesterase
LGRHATVKGSGRVSIVFVGDIHQQWDKVARGVAALRDRPRAAVLLGDIQCEKPLDELAAPFLDRGIAVHWIFGNHDNDGGPDMWANLADPARNPRTAAGALHGRVTEIAGLRVAGLGGTFRPRVWDPPAEPRLRARAELEADVRGLGPSWQAAHLQALHHSLSTAAIWPEDYEALATRRADILVTHEAPASHPSGKAALDRLARVMGARLIVHGHHHLSYRARSADGLSVMGVGAAWGAALDGAVLWEGDTHRPMTRRPADWMFGDDAA